MPDEAGHVTRNALRWEVGIVLGLSLGASAIYSVVSIIARLTDTRPLSEQSATLNGSQSPREWLDFTYQFLGIFFAFFAVALVLYLLWRPGQSAFRRLGFDLTEPRRDLLRGLGLVAAIGIPGLGLYLAGRFFGFTVAVVPSPIDTFWWTVPILVLSALRSALTEELIVVGYLFTRLRELGWSTWTIIVSSAVLRGSYHLYQGIGPFFGNAVMGVVFGWCYLRWGRTMPLVIAHWVLDIVSFVGYPLALAWWPGLLAPTAA
ncbi:CPBP family intramembrane metalloprotease [Cryobacterium sp. TMT1-21]|nr:CPBP family intramembrane metalloprotease [Cryobacterium sp. TmT2-59]TFD15850.1 CPBP family intramembrane metalloprotease [Cryobacterium sp. TMT4-10]TFD17121.1 CPBP family intramembrane metalloprotease [Cryobacterium sp. TMT1-21]TFD18238.1 CPBP family intramembrane metalloprotease [Cryobacterium sp. TMT2-23]TFD41454.1 CPBP family intramembrane metalloprotease [Cryobacterium sp. TMT2-10]